jgi:signal transduction histidine kinase
MKTGEIVAMAKPHAARPRGTAKSVPIDDSAAPIRDETRAVIGSVLVFRDVTERRRADRERKRLEDELRTRVRAALRGQPAQERVPRDAVARIALIRWRRSATSSRCYQLRGPKDSELVAARDVIDRQVELMSRLLDDLPRRQPGSIATSSNCGASACRCPRSSRARSRRPRPSIVQAQHKLSIELPAGRSRIDADPMRLAQVFSNLLTNAAKYTDPGGLIALTGRRDGNQVAISVADSGIGIDRQSLDGLFEMFAQVPAAMARAQGGVGIGLSLAKGLVELHGGTISVRSEGLGKGKRLHRATADRQRHAGRARRAAGDRAQREQAADPDLRRLEGQRRQSSRGCCARSPRRAHGLTTARARFAQGRRCCPRSCCSTSACRDSTLRRDAAASARSRGAVDVPDRADRWGEEADRRPRRRRRAFDRTIMLKPVQCEALAAVLDAIPSPRLKD